MNKDNLKFYTGVFIFIIAILLTLTIQLKNVEEPYKLYLFIFCFGLIIIGVYLTEIVKTSESMTSY